MALPPDPFPEAPDFTAWATNMRAMFVALEAVGFSEEQAIRLTLGMMTAIISRKLCLPGEI